MATLYTHQAANRRKTWFLMSLFLIIVIALGFLFAQIYGEPYILYGFVVFSIVMNVVAYWQSDKIVIKLSGAKQVKFEDNKELYRLLENLAITAGLPMPRLYIVQDEVPNAFATGRDPEHAVVAVTTGLLKVLDKSELEGVLAHELSHIGNRDMLVSTVAVVLVGFVAIVSDFFLRISIWGSSDNDSKAGTILFIVGIIAAVLAPLAASLIQLAISRKREFLADASGAMLTRYPEGLASALEKIAAGNKKMKKAHHATAHLYLADPFGEKTKGFIHRIFATHPPAEERIKALRGG